MRRRFPTRQPPTRLPRQSTSLPFLTASAPARNWIPREVHEGLPQLSHTLLSGSRWCFYALLVAAPWALSWKAHGIWPELYLSDVPLLAMFGLWLMGHLVAPGRPLRTMPRPLFVGLAGLLVTAAVSSVGAMDLSLALDATIRIFLAFALVACVADLLPAPTMSALALVAGGLINAPVAVAQYASQQRLGLDVFGEIRMIPDGSDWWLRAYGLTPHPNILGGVLALAILGILGFLLAGPRVDELMWYCLVAILAAGLVASYSRSAWLGLACCLSLAFIVGQGRQRLVVLVGATWIAVSVVFVVASPGRYVGRVILPALDIAGVAPASNREMADLGERVEQHQIAFALLREERPFGVGPANFLDASALLHQRHLPYAVAPVHDVPLLIMVEQGPAGFVFWIIAYGYVFTETVRFRSRRSQGWTTLWAIGIAFTLVVGFFDFYFWVWEQGRLLGWSLFGLWAASRRYSETEWT